MIQELQKLTIPVSDYNSVKNVATISANGDSEVGDLIAGALEKVGKDGTLTIQDGKTLHNEVDIVEGMKFDRGYISPYFVTDPKTQKVELEGAYILMTEKKINNIQHILPILEHAMKAGRPLLIVADDVESEALATLVVNKLRGGLKVCAVKCPGFGDNRKNMLTDIAILTGGTVVSEEVGLTLETAEPEVLGEARTIEITKDDTLIMNGMGAKEHLEERIQ